MLPQEEKSVSSPMGIKQIKEYEKIRLLLYQNGNIVHVGLKTVISPLLLQLEALTKRVEKLEQHK